MEKGTKDIVTTISSNIDDRTEGSILASLWRKILRDLNITNRIPYLISLYVEKSNETSLRMKKKSKSSITNDITAESMTWKVFINNITGVLKIKHITFTVTLHHANGEETNHSVDIKT